MDQETNNTQMTVDSHAIRDLYQGVRGLAIKILNRIDRTDVKESLLEILDCESGLLHHDLLYVVPGSTHCLFLARRSGGGRA